MKTFNDLCKDLKEMGEIITSKGGEVPYTTRYPSITALKDGINSIPQVVIQNNSYSIICADTANTEFTLLDAGNNVIDTKTNDATIGGYVIFTPSEVGTYTISAKQNNTVKWTNSISVASSGIVYNCKSSLALDNYSEDEIDLAAKNHYARYIWNLGDFKICTSFIGSTSTSYTKRYIVDFDKDILSDGTGNAEITWAWLDGTPSTYKLNNTSINNTSYEGSLGRQYLLPANSIYYLYDNTVTSTTTGTYYIHNYTLGTWETKTLPDEYSEIQDYYTQQTVSADGAIYAGIPSDLISKFVATKQKTWVGFTSTETKLSTTQRKVSTKIITTNDKLFLMSGHQHFGNANGTSYFGYNNNENDQYALFKNYNGYPGDFFSYSVDKWYRSPKCSHSSNFCYWNSSGNVNYNSASYSLRFVVCACQ